MRDLAIRFAGAENVVDLERPFMGSEVSLRWIYTHMIAEYARHCGHADILREQILAARG